MSPQALDPQAVNLAKAIRQTESGGSFTASGKSGEYGAYQYTEPTWQKDSAAAGVNVPLKQATPSQQNEVAYKKIKALKDQGLNIGQIASVWNSGKPDAYLDATYKGVNSAGAKFDVPAYAKSVATAYQKIKSGGQVGVDPQNPSSIAAPQGPAISSPKPGLGEQLTGRVQDISNEVSQGSTGQINPASAALQVAGSAAGAIGDVTNAAINLIPGVGTLEDGLNSIVGSLAGTSMGQSVVQAGKDFATAHPEAAADMGALLNVASVFPMFKGLTVLKGAALDAVSTTFEKRLAGAATKELTDASERLVAGQKIIKGASARGLDPVATIIGKPGTRFLPSVVSDASGNAIYDTQSGYRLAQESLSQNEDELQQMLKGSHSDAGISLDSVQKEAIALARKEGYGALNTKDLITRQIPKEFENLKYSIGGKTYVDVKDLNDLKRTVRSGLNWKSEKLQEDAAYYMSKAMMSRVEKEAENAGVKGVHELNKKMASKIEAMKLLKHLDGHRLKGVKPHGLLRQGISAALTAGGEAAGNAAGLPFAGALIGRGAGGLVRKAPGAGMRSLNRVGSSGGIARAGAKGLLRTATPGLTQGLLQK